MHVNSFANFIVQYFSKHKNCDDFFFADTLNCVCLDFTFYFLENLGVENEKDFELLILKISNEFFIATFLIFRKFSRNDFNQIGTIPDIPTNEIKQPYFDDKILTHIV